MGVRRDERARPLRSAVGEPPHLVCNPQHEHQYLQRRRPSILTPTKVRDIARGLKSLADEYAAVGMHHEANCMTRGSGWWLAYATTLERAKTTLERAKEPTGVVVVIPWLLEREYRQHRRLDPTGLPKTFIAWRREAQARAARMARLRVGRVVRVVIHPGELEARARQAGHPVDDEARFNFAEIVWRRR